MGRAATDEPLQPIALAPVSRGEGGVRGTAPEFDSASQMSEAADPSPYLSPRKTGARGPEAARTATRDDFARFPRTDSANFQITSIRSASELLRGFISPGPLPGGPGRGDRRERTNPGAGSGEAGEG